MGFTLHGLKKSEVKKEIERVGGFICAGLFFSPVKLKSCCNAVFTYALYFLSAKILSVCA